MLELELTQLKVPLEGLILQLNGNILEMARETNQVYELKTVNLSKFDMELRGLDGEGFLRINVVPRKVNLSIDARRQFHEIKPPISEFDPSRRRIDDVEVRLPPEFSLYDVFTSTQGSKYEIYKNEGKCFVLKVKTRYRKRHQSLGDLNEPDSYISRFLKIFTSEDRWFSKNRN